MDLYPNLTPRVSSAKKCRGIKCIWKWGEKEDDCITMLSSLDYLGRSWGVKTRKVWGGAVQCGRGQGNAQEMRTRCEQRTETFGAVRAEDKNFLPATSVIGILCRLTWLTWQRSSVQQQSATSLYLIFTHSFFVTQTSGLYSIFNSSLLKFFHPIVIWKRCVYQL